MNFCFVITNMSITSNRITAAADKMRRGDHSHYTKSVDVCVEAIETAREEGCVEFTITRTQSLHPRAIAELKQNFDVMTHCHRDSYVYECALRKA
jgi:hypothetical protein